MLSFIVPFYNKWELTHARLMEFYNFLPRDGVEIVLVNDASTEDVRLGVGFWQQSVKLPIRFISHKENKGFGASMNTGAKHASGDTLIFYSNDVIMKKPIAPIITTAITDDNALYGPQIVYWPAGWNEFDVDGNKVIVPYVNGWLLACTRSAWDKLGGFDALYGKYDFEDVDLSTTAWSLGMKLKLLHLEGCVQHLGGETIKSLGVDRLSHTEKNRQLYISKWADRLMEIQRNINGNDITAISQ